MIAGGLRDRLTDHGLVVMNRIAGIAIGTFGIVTIALSRAAAF
jgi:hypothetical protein